MSVFVCMSQYECVCMTALSLVLTPPFRFVQDGSGSRFSRVCNSSPCLRCSPSIGAEAWGVGVFLSVSLSLPPSPGSWVPLTHELKTELRDHPHHHSVLTRLPGSARTGCKQADRPASQSV